MDRILIYTALLYETESEACLFLTRKKISYLVVKRDGILIEKIGQFRPLRILLSVIAGRVTSFDWG